MAKINLLPWRAERREHRKREFFSRLVIAAIAAIVLVLLWGFWTSLRVDNQNSRNAYLQSQIKQLDAKIAEIKSYQKEKDRLLARKQIVEKLQSSRSQMVHLFDQIVKTIPAGARLTSLKQQGDKLTLDGVAQSNATVAEYMRNIEASPWMGPAQLVKTENVHTNSNTPYEFELVVKLGTPKSNAKTAAPAAGSSSATPATTATTQPAAASTPETASAVASASTPVASAAAPAAVAHAPGSAVAASASAKRAPAASMHKGGARP